MGGREQFSEACGAWLAESGWFVFIVLDLLGYPLLRQSAEKVTLKPELMRHQIEDHVDPERVRDLL